ncbi:DUF3604 domain-containing protein [Parahaliea aestuarii]|uniref:DUF3604 domain-containing protein n=1 Tax=Parahaliea aestuarii TaxID=1852021 RepID=A0A5C8ZUX2_9GAMM|nr:DUF3604 domain-containing protein [Parahaliea aestuarii]TXS91619.1 DUF3604 domain-containing protein [Parahaliea aestuarii]
MPSQRRRIVFTLAAALLPLLTFAVQAESERDPRQDYSPWAGKDYPREVYWGDTHLHTSVSMDANLFGVTGLGPEDAYRFARGETVTAANGMPARLSRPLDFLVVADHAEYLGVMPLIRSGDPILMQNSTARAWQRIVAEGDPSAYGRLMLDIGNSYEDGEPLLTLPQGIPSPWEANNRAADAANQPGVFTAFVGFEWSAMPGGDNLHRIVVFGDGADHANQVTPFSAFDSDDPEDLWRWLADYEEKTGGKVLAIPHNSNLSGGRMFAETAQDGRPLDSAYARERQRWEPLMEVTQIKGDSEAHPLLSPDDAFADYGTWDQYNIAMNSPQTPAMQRYQYARPALQVGLQLEQSTGVNPYNFGMIGSTDSHTALAAVEEDNFWGKKAGDEPGPRRSQTFWGIPEANMPNTLQLASGYAAVWATENTREALFDAMQRREVYATTGPRIRLRFFGGWHFTENDLAGPNPALTGYEKGVPMGAYLPPAGDGAPRFMLHALKDPEGANLDRMQVIKGWLDESGAAQERVYNVAWSGNRDVDQQGELPPVGNTVDLDNGRYANSIGSAELSTVWQDPDFDPAQAAVYYVRVLEIPTPRWVLFDRARLGVELPPDTELVQQERAYSSPIWFRPDTRSSGASRDP